MFKLKIMTSEQSKQYYNDNRQTNSKIEGKQEKRLEYCGYWSTIDDLAEN